MRGDPVSVASPPRVLYLLWQGTLRGAERHVFDLATELPRDRFSPMVCFFAAAGGYGPLLGDAGVPVVELGCTNTKLDLRAARRFSQLLRRETVRIVHDHGAPLWARAATKLIPDAPRVVYTEHLTTATPLRRWVYPLVRHLTDAHIAVSDAARTTLVSALGVRASEVTVIANSVDPARVVPLPPHEVAAVRNMLGLEMSDEVILAVARLERGKRVGRLVELLAPLVAARPRAHLLIAGDGGERESLAGRIAASTSGDRIRLLGARTDVPRLLAAADIVVSLSERESFGLAIAEAMLAGKPVVAASAPGVREIVVPGHTGMLVSDEHLDADFAAAVTALLNDPAAGARMGESGRARVLADYSPRRMVAETVRVYECLVRPAA